MREIKFRQFYLGKFHYWGFTKLGEFVGPLNDTLQYKIESQQYTGLKDKNGKEIYEGDLVKKKHTNMNKLKSENLIHKVVFSHGAFQLDNEVDEDFLDFDFDLHESELEIIGNIYENPELLNP